MEPMTFGYVFRHIYYSYSCGDVVYAMQDATKLAMRVVANYGLDAAIGITTYAPTPSRLGFMQKSFEVAVDNIDEDLYGTSIDGGFFQPSDNSWHAMKSRAADIVKEAYMANLKELHARKEAMGILSDLLLEKETVFGEEVMEIIKQYQPAGKNPMSSSL